MIKQKDINKFWRYILFPQDCIIQCWNWNGKIHKTTKLPIFWIHTGKQYTPKTFSYIIHNNFVEVDGRSIIQMCDNNLCVNPHHLQKHDLSLSREHKCFESIVARTLRPNHKWYLDYGGRGIDLDPRYNPDVHLKGVGFLNFINDLKDLNLWPIPDGLSIDRIDNNKGYWKTNITLSTPEEQSQNRRNNKLTKSDVVFIRNSKNKLTAKRLSYMYNCHKNYIYDIWSGKNWANI